MLKEGSKWVIQGLGSPADGALQRVNSLIQACRQCLLEGKQMPILTSFGQKFNQDTLCFQLSTQRCSRMDLNTKTLPQLLRILEIVVLCRDNLLQGKKVTKRSLYYHLSHYYPDYKTIDADLQLICSNLSLSFSPQVVSRDLLGVLASARGMVFGLLEIEADGECICRCEGEASLTILPTSHQIVARRVPPNCKIVLVEKQSVFFEIVETLRKYKGESCLEGYTVITARGYPDWMTRRFLCTLASQHPLSIHYCGDYDVFGFDIFLCYCFGDWTCPGLHRSIRLLDLGGPHQAIFDYSKLTYDPFDDKDEAKASNIDAREYFAGVKDCTRTDSPFPQQLHNIALIYAQFRKFIEKGKKCETEQFIGASLTPFWFHQLTIKN